MAPAPESPNPPVTKRRFLIAGIVLIVLVGVGLLVGGIWYLVDTTWLSRSRPPRPLFTDGGPPVPASATPAPGRIASSAAAATREAPFVNFLGMRFVPAGTSGQLMSAWETRVSDFRPFALATKFKDGGMSVPAIILRSRDGKNTLDAIFSGAATWEEPGFPQGEDYPVVGIDFERALKFCAWLTQREHAAGILPPDAFYTLPTDEEWSVAAGSGRYPWGDAWPPPAGSANLLDAAALKKLPGRGWAAVEFDDGAAMTARVGSYAANSYGIHDLAGNVAEWCYGRYRSALNSADFLEEEPSLYKEVLWGGSFLAFNRGGSWQTAAPQGARTALRAPNPIFYQSSTIGFRLVLILSPRTGADFNRRGYSAELSDRPAEALADLNRGLALDSTDILALGSRLRLHKDAGRFREQLADYEALHQHHGDVSVVTNDFAWLLAICPDDSVRDGARAVKLATEACNSVHTKNEAFVDTLAAAYAEVGDWENAVSKQREAIELTKNRSPRLIADMQSRLDLYLQQKPYRKSEKPTAETEP